MYYSDSDSELASSEVEFALQNADPRSLSAEMMFVQWDDRGPLSPLGNLPLGSGEDILRRMTPVQRMMVEWRLTPNPYQREIQEVVDDLIRRTEVRAEVRQTMELVGEIVDCVVNRAWSEYEEHRILSVGGPLNFEYIYDHYCGSSLDEFDSEEDDSEEEESDHDEEESNHGREESDHGEADDKCDKVLHSKEPNRELHTSQNEFSGSEADDNNYESDNEAGDKSHDESDNDADGHCDKDNCAENSQDCANVEVSGNTGGEMRAITLQDLKNSRVGNKFQCLLCPKVTTTLDQMKEHLKSKKHKGKANLAFTVQRVCCPFCDTYISKNIGQVVGHIKTKHKEVQIQEVVEGTGKRKREYFMSDFATPIDFKKIHI